MDHIVHGVNKLTCALHDTPHIACDNQLLAIDALHLAIQRWTKTTGPPQTKPHRTTLSHTCNRPHSILRPMRRPQEDRPPASPPRVVIPKTPAILIPQIPITSQDEPIARRTRSRFPTMKCPPPRVNKKLTQCKLLVAHVNKPQPWPLSSPQPKRPNDNIQPSFFKV